MEIKEIEAKLEALGPQFKEMALTIGAFLKSKKDPVFKVVNAGVMNPGKSTLMNALLGKKEVFKTADVRQTVVTQKEQWKEDMCLYDTPGCSSAVLADDKESFAAFRQSDMILFIHNLMNGGLTAAEMKILSGIKEIYGSEDFCSRVCLVGTRSDECDDDEVKRNMAEVEELIHAILQTNLKTFIVSPIYHFQGLALKTEGNTEDSQTLIRLGGIETLKRYLMTRKRVLGKRGNARISQFVDCLMQQMASLKAAEQTLRTDLTRTRNQARKNWERSLLNIQTAWQECR